MRLQKYISAAGICSRREAEQRILDGRVTVNGQIAALGQSVDETVDQVCVDGRPVRPPRECTYVMLHKPRGYVTTMKDERGRPTVAQLVSDAEVRLYPVGRLDYDSEGLLIMTNDGEVANRLAHPSHGVKKTYHVWVKGTDLPAAAEKLRHPMSYQGINYKGAKVELLTDEGDGRGKLAVTIGDGKNREVRNMCAAAELKVLRLQRISQGELRLGNLPAGEWRYLTSKETQYLQNLQ